MWLVVSFVGSMALEDFPNGQEFHSRKSDGWKMVPSSIVLLFMLFIIIECPTVREEEAWSLDRCKLWQHSPGQGKIKLDKGRILKKKAKLLWSMQIKTKKNFKVFPNYRIPPLNVNFTCQLQGALLKMPSSHKNPKLWPKTASETLVFTLVGN